MILLLLSNATRCNRAAAGDYDANSGYLYRIGFNGSTVWQLTNMDNYNRITQATIGSASSTWAFSSSSNLLSQITATGVQQYNYSFNSSTGNLESRTNYLKSLTESFGYDTNGLDRLTSVTGPSAQTLAYTSNQNGNILTKSDAGAYSYDDTPYAVTGIANGLNIDTARQAIEYYSFEKVKKITENGKTAEFAYNADMQRIQMILKNNGTVTKTRYYFGGSCERETEGSTTTQYIWIGGDAYTAVAVAKKVGSGSWTVYNIFRDHLGTITHLKTGSTISEYSFDAWGRRRDKDNWSYTLSSEPALFAGRGFTAHEYLEDFKLYNMNGRLYDPVVGRFLSPDPVVQDPGFTQSMNRYSYCLNNPLKYADPSGYKWKWNYLNPLHWFDEGMQWINDNTKGLRQKMTNLGIPDFSIGTSVNLDGNVNFKGSYRGQEVFNTENIDRSNANKVVWDEITGVRQAYGEEWWEATYSKSNWVSDAWNSAIGRWLVPDFIAIGVGFSGIVGTGGTSSVELRWVTHGPQSSFKPMVTVTQSVGGGYSVDATLNIETTRYIGNSDSITRKMMITNTPGGDLPTFWGCTGVADVGKIGATGYITPNNGSFLIGMELNLGVGLAPGNGAGGISNTWILYDFYK